MSEQKFDPKVLNENILKGIALAYERLVLKTRQEDGELILSQNGQIVRVKARDIVLPSETPEQQSSIAVCPPKKRKC